MDKNVWVKEEFKKYNDKVNELLISEIGHCNRLSQDVIARKPHSMLQSLILLDILCEIKELNKKISDNNIEENKEVVIKDKVNIKKTTK